MIELKLLLLLLIANGTPILARHLLGSRFDFPLDGGTTTARGKRWLGPSKTVRGLLAAILATAVAATLLGFPWITGGLVGLLAMLGDLSASFIKRRLGLPPSSQATGLDQLPESLLPMLYCVLHLDLDWYAMFRVVFGFWISEILLSRLLFRLGIRRHPY
ncbi:MAG: CDP-archaeol synthase [Chromatiales bacterium]|jgi:CDP-2,3-bis-(O-geranylgeranyl)-sn-glycerol synthase